MSESHGGLKSARDSLGDLKSARDSLGDLRSERDSLGDLKSECESRTQKLVSESRGAQKKYFCFFVVVVKCVV